MGRRDIEQIAQMMKDFQSDFVIRWRHSPIDGLSWVAFPRSEPILATSPLGLRRQMETERTRRASKSA
jgi:hypothetical protein